MTNNFATAAAHDERGFSNALMAWERAQSEGEIVDNDSPLITVDFSDPWND